MAHLWVKNGSDEWAVLPLEADAYSLATNPPRRWRLFVSGPLRLGRLFDARVQDDEPRGADLRARARGRVNGFAVASGCRRRLPREVSVGGVGTFYFST